MPDFYFFTEPHKLNPQTPEQAYGPIEAGESDTVDRYRVSNLFTAQPNSAPKAIAITRGKVCIQQDTENAHLVNLIIQPQQLPNLPLPQVAFFIYKGIRKESFLTTANEVAERSQNDLTEILHKATELLQAVVPTAVGPPSPSSLGYDRDDSTGYALSDALAKVFHESSTLADLVTVKAGTHLGTFDEASFGLEIILDATYAPATLAAARTVDHLLEVPIAFLDPSPINRMDQRRIREAVLGYLDAAAFFGAFHQLGLHTQTNNGTAVKYRDTELYNQALLPFYNRSMVYLEIENGLGAPFNAFENLGDTVSISFEEGGAAQSFDYYGEAWPLLRIPGSQFPMAPLDIRQRMDIRLPKGDYAAAKAVVQVGYSPVANEDGTYGLKPIQGRSRFIDVAFPEEANESTPITLAVPHASHAGTVVPIAHYAKLTYARAFDVTAGARSHNDPVLQVRHYLDALFEPFEMVAALENSGDGANQKVSGEVRYLQDENQLSQPRNVRVGANQEEGLYSFFAQTEDTTYPDLNERSQMPLRLLTQKTPLGHRFLKDIAIRDGGGSFRGNTVEINGQSTPYATLESNAAGRSPFTVSKVSELISLTITPADYQTLVQKRSQLSADQRIFLGVRQVGRAKASERERLQIHELVLMGSTSTNDFTQYRSQEVSTGLYIHTVDQGHIYSTVSAAKELGVTSALLPENQDDPLRSYLFAGDPMLHLINLGRFVPDTNPITRELPQGSFIRKIQKALKILNPALADTKSRATDLFLKYQNDRQYRADGVLGSRAKELITTFQELANKPVNQQREDTHLEEDGILGAQTIRRMDRELERVAYYDINQEKVIHDLRRSTPVGAFTVVSNGHIRADSIGYQINEHYNPSDPNQAQQAIQIRNSLQELGYLDAAYIVTDLVTDELTQLAGATGDTAGYQTEIIQLLKAKNGAAFCAEPNGPVVRQLPYNTRVRIVEVVGDRTEEGLDRGWCYIETSPDLEASDEYDTERGYVRTVHLWTRSAMPEPTAKLYTIDTTDSDGLLGLAKRLYNTGRQKDIVTGSEREAPSVDSRYYANALLYANNPEGESTKTIHSLDVDETGDYTVALPNQPAAIYLKDGFATIWELLKKASPFDPLVRGMEKNVPLLSPIQDGEGNPSLASRALDSIEEFFSDQLKKEKNTTTWKAWADTRIRANSTIWVPSIAYCDNLKEYINQGSAIKSLIRTASYVIDPFQELRRAMFEKANKFFKDELAEWLDEHWQIGTGFSLDTTTAVSFFLYAPIGVEVKSSTYIWRESAPAAQGSTAEDKPQGSVLKMMVRGEYAAGIEIDLKQKGYKGVPSLGQGLGAGSLVTATGKGKQKRGGLSDEDVAYIKAGGKLVTQEEFAFDLAEDYAVALVLLTAIKGDPGSPLGIGGVNRALVNAFCHLLGAFNIGPYQYLTMSKVEIGAYLNGKLSIDLIPKLSGGDEAEGTAISNLAGSLGLSSDTINNSSLGKFFSKLRLQFDLGFDMGAGLGLEMEFKDYFIHPESGARIPKTTTGSIYFEGTANAQADLNYEIPDIIPLPDKIKLAKEGNAFRKKFGGGAGAKIIYERTSGLAKRNGTYGDDEFRLKEWAIYFKQGAMDTIQGPANELTIKFNPIDFNKLPGSIDAVMPYFKSIESKVRKGYTLGNKAWEQKGKFKLTFDLLSKANKLFTGVDNPVVSVGVGLDAYITYQWQVNANAVLDLVKLIVEDIKENSGDQSKEAIYYLLSYFILGKVPEKKSHIVAQIMKAFEVRSVRLHLSTSLQGALQLKVKKYKIATGATIRVILLEGEYLPLFEQILEKETQSFQELMGNLHRELAQTFQDKFGIHIPLELPAN